LTKTINRHSKKNILAQAGRYAYVPKSMGLKRIEGEKLFWRIGYTGWGGSV
jgi:hypothetical protein